MHAHRHGLDVRVEAGGPGRLPGFVHGDRERAGDVVENTGGGEPAVLEDHSHAGAGRRHVETRSIVAVEEDRTRIGPFEAEQKAVDRRFPGAGRTDEGHEVARADVEGHPVDRVRDLRQIAEGHVRELDLPGQVSRVGAAAGGLGLFLEDRLDTLEERDGGHHRRPRRGQSGHRAGELPEGGIEGEEVREVERLLQAGVDEHVPDEGEDGEHAQRREQAVEGELACSPAARGKRLPFLYGITFRPSRQRVVFGVRHPELGEPGDHLEDEAVDHSLGGERGAMVFHRAVREEPGHADEDEDQTARAQREPPAIVEQQSVAEDGEDAADHRARGGAGQHHPDQADAVRPVGQISGGESAEERRRQREQPAPDRGLEALVDPALDAQQREGKHDVERHGAERGEEQRGEVGDPHRRVHARDDLGQELAGQDRGQQGEQGAQDAHGPQGADIPPAPAQGVLQGRQPVFDPNRKRRMEHHASGLDPFGLPGAHVEGRAVDRVYRAIGAASVRKQGERPLVLAPAPDERGPVPPPPAGGEGDLPRADAGRPGDLRHGRDRVGVVFQIARDVERGSNGLGHDAGRRLQRRPGFRYSHLVIPGRAQHLAEIPKHRLPAPAAGLVPLAVALVRGFDLRDPGEGRILEGQRAETVEGRPEPPRDRGGRGVDRRNLAVLVDLAPGPLGDRHEVAVRLDDQLMTPHEAHRPVGGHPDDVRVVRAHGGARGIRHVRVGVEQQRVPRGRTPATDHELGEAEHPLVDPDHRVEVEVLIGDDVGTQPPGDRRTHGRNGQEAEEPRRPFRAHQALDAETHCAGRDAGDERPAADPLLVHQLDREDVQMALLDPEDELRIVHEEGLVRPGREGLAMDAFGHGVVGHRFNST